jgi:hypothetical protein
MRFFDEYLCLSKLELFVQLPMVDHWLELLEIACQCKRLRFTWTPSRRQGVLYVDVPVGSKL